MWIQTISLCVNLVVVLNGTETSHAGETCTLTSEMLWSWKKMLDYLLLMAFVIIVLQNLMTPRLERAKRIHSTKSYNRDLSIKPA